MKAYLMAQIENHRKAIYHALDSGDWISAMQSRAVQRELEQLLEKVDDSSTLYPDVALDEYYDSREVAALFGVSPTSVTRQAAGLGGVKRNNIWFFPKARIESEVPFRTGRTKRGRGSKRTWLSDNI